MGRPGEHPSQIYRAGDVRIVPLFQRLRSRSGLERAEGLLLRHLNSVYNALTQTVPDTAKDDEVREIELYLGEMIRQVVSSLLDEWKKMRDPSYQAEESKEVRPRGAADAVNDITRDTKAFTALVRTRIFAFLRALSVADYEAAMDALDEKVLERTDSADGQSEIWTTDRLRESYEKYRTEHDGIRLDPEARNLRHTYTTPSKNGSIWNLAQVLVDPDEHNDWNVEFEVDIIKSRTDGKPVLHLHRFGEIE